jgi:hypothetical protein
MSLKLCVTVKEAVDLLNELLEIDYDAIYALINNRVSCNESLADHETVVVWQPEGEGPTVGVLGILNGLFGIREDGMGAICVEIDELGKILLFKETPGV